MINNKPMACAAQSTNALDRYVSSVYKLMILNKLIRLKLIRPIDGSSYLYNYNTAR